MVSNLPKIETVHRFFYGTGFSYNKVVAICTLGFDRYWKRKIVAKIPNRPDCIIDQACGTGILTLDIARRFPNCRVIGVELRDEYLCIAREKARTLGIGNVDFILGRAEDVMLEVKCDCITSSYLAKYAELGLLIANAAKMLRPGGLIILHDFTYPSKLVFLLLWKAYFQLLRMIGGKVYPEWKTVFSELPEFLRQSEWVSESSSLLRENGFRDITTESFTLATAAIVTAKKT